MSPSRCMKRWISGQGGRATPRLQVGEIVKDRTGAQLGSIESVADAERGPMVVIKIDGKLSSVPQSTLTR